MPDTLELDTTMPDAMRNNIIVSYNDIWWYRARILDLKDIEGVPVYNVGFYGFLKFDTEWIPVDSPRIRDFDPEGFIVSKFHRVFILKSQEKELNTWNGRDHRRKTFPAVSRSSDQLLLSYPPGCVPSRDDIIFTAIDFKATKRDVARLFNSVEFETDISELQPGSVLLILLLAGPMGLSKDEIKAKIDEYEFLDNFPDGLSKKIAVPIGLKKIEKEVRFIPSSGKFALKIFPAVAVPVGGRQSPTGEAATAAAAAPAGGSKEVNGVSGGGGEVSVVVEKKPENASKIKKSSNKGSIASDSSTEKRNNLAAAIPALAPAAATEPAAEVIMPSSKGARRARTPMSRIKRKIPPSSNGTAESGGNDTPKAAEDMDIPLDAAAAGNNDDGGEEISQFKKRPRQVFRRITKSTVIDALHNGPTTSKNQQHSPPAVEDGTLADGAAVLDVASVSLFEKMKKDTVLLISNVANDLKWSVSDTKTLLHYMDGQRIKSTVAILFVHGFVSSGKGGFDRGWLFTSKVLELLWSREVVDNLEPASQFLVGVGRGLQAKYMRQSQKNNDVGGGSDGAAGDGKCGSVKNGVSGVKDSAAAVVSSKDSEEDGEVLKQPSGLTEKAPKFFLQNAAKAPVPPPPSSSQKQQPQKVAKPQPIPVSTAIGGSAVAKKSAPLANNGIGAGGGGGGASKRKNRNPQSTIETTAAAVEYGKKSTGAAAQDGARRSGRVRPPAGYHKLLEQEGLVDDGEPRKFGRGSDGGRKNLTVWEDGSSDDESTSSDEEERADRTPKEMIYDLMAKYSHQAKRSKKEEKEQQQQRQQQVPGSNLPLTNTTPFGGHRPTAAFKTTLPQPPAAAAGVNTAVPPGPQSSTFTTESAALNAERLRLLQLAHSLRDVVEHPSVLNQATVQGLPIRDELRRITSALINNTLGAAAAAAAAGNSVGGVPAADRAAAAGKGGVGVGVSGSGGVVQKHVALQTQPQKKQQQPVAAPVPRLTPSTTPSITTTSSIIDNMINSINSISRSGGRIGTTDAMQNLQYLYHYQKQRQEQLLREEQQKQLQQKPQKKRKNAPSVDANKTLNKTYLAKNNPTTLGFQGNTTSIGNKTSAPGAPRAAPVQYPPSLANLTAPGARTAAAVPVLTPSITTQTPLQNPFNAILSQIKSVGGGSLATGLLDAVKTDNPEKYKALAAQIISSLRGQDARPAAFPRDLCGADGKLSVDKVAIAVKNLVRPMATTTTTATGTGTENNNTSTENNTSTVAAAAGGGGTIIGGLSNWCPGAPPSQLPPPRPPAPPPSVTTQAWQQYVRTQAASQTNQVQQQQQQQQRQQVAPRQPPPTFSGTPIASLAAAAGARAKAPPAGNAAATKPSIPAAIGRTNSTPDQDPTTLIKMTIDVLKQLPTLPLDDQNQAKLAVEEAMAQLKSVGADVPGELVLLLKLAGISVVYSGDGGGGGGASGSKAATDDGNAKNAAPNSAPKSTTVIANKESEVINLVEEPKGK